MDVSSALDIQLQCGRPLVDVRWLMACLAAPGPVPYDDYMIVATLTEVGSSQSAPHEPLEPPSSPYSGRDHTHGAGEGGGPIPEPDSDGKAPADEQTTEAILSSPLPVPAAAV